MDKVEFLVANWPSFGPEDADLINQVVQAVGWEVVIEVPGTGQGCHPGMWAGVFCSVSEGEREEVTLRVGDGNGKKKIKKL